MNRRRIVTLLLMGAGVALVTTMLWSLMITRREGEILREGTSSRYTSNKLENWKRDFAFAFNEGGDFGVTNTIQFDYSHGEQPTEIQRKAIEPVLQECIQHLQRPDWSNYVRLKASVPSVASLGPVSTTFESFWLKGPVPGKSGEDRAREMFRFIYENPERQPVPRLVQILDDKIEIHLKTSSDVPMELFNALRSRYDGLATRALDDVFTPIAASKIQRDRHVVAFASGIGITSLNGTPAPFVMSIEWDEDTLKWWPSHFMTSHPGFAPMF